MDNGFKFYTDWEDIFKCFSDEEISLLLKAILDYAFRGKKTDFADRALKVAYISITDTIDRDRSIDFAEGGDDDVSIY